MDEVRATDMSIGKSVVFEFGTQHLGRRFRSGGGEGIPAEPDVPIERNNSC